MSDQEQQPVFSIEKVYVKDVSLEVPNSPHVFLEPSQPQFEVQLTNSAERINEALFEVLVKVTVTAKVSEKVYFLVEAAQAGIFQIRNVPDKELSPVLGIGCPTILFPYLRETVADLISRAGFPPIHLAPIDFQAMYSQQQQQQQRQRGNKDDGPKIEIAH